MVGLLTFGGGGRGAGGVVHNRESRDFRSPEVNISATFTPSRNYPVYTKKTVTSMLVNNRSRVDERSILRNGQVLHELITFLHI